MPTKDDETVTESCGCVFCDLNLEPEEIDGRWVHEAYGNRLKCTRSDGLLESIARTRAGIKAAFRRK